jgi:hypothetical protein
MSFKILKFNESQKRYPIEVDEEEFLQKKTMYKKVNFTDNETDIIFRIMAKKKREKSEDGETMKITYPSSESFEFEFSFISYGKWKYVISKLDDDWFCISFYDISSYETIFRYFICDEFEEVINFLTDKISP